MTTFPVDILARGKSALVGVYGTGGFGREVMGFLEDHLEHESSALRHLRLVFIETEPRQSLVNDMPVLSEEEFFSVPDVERFFNIAIADSKARERLAASWAERDATPLTMRARTALVYGHVSIGEGAILCPSVTITSNAVVGRYFHANIYSYIAHDCVIGDYVTFAPNVHCNGNVRIGDHAYIGTGAMIRQGQPSKPLQIGEGAIVGMGAVVTKDVPAGATVVGNPARVLAKE